MTNKELETALNKLIQELDKIDKTDVKTKESLQKLIDSVQSILNEPEKKEQHNEVLGKLKEEAIQFEIKHPLINNALEELIDILARLGI